jgi:hypothetical protein
MLCVTLSLQRKTMSSRIFASPMASTAAKAKLAQDLPSILCNHGHSLTPQAQAALADGLADAIGRAMSGPDLEAAAQLDRKGQSWLRRRLEAKRSRQKPVQLPNIGKNRSAMQVPPLGAGRPGNTAQDLLLHDVRKALLAVGLPNGFKGGAENLLSDVLRACADAAQLALPQDLKHIWENAREISEIKEFGSPQT